MSMLNSNVRIQNRTGTTNISTVSLLAWWTNATFNVFDPKLAYDPISSRWIATASTEPINNALLVAVSQTSDPTGAWYFQRIDADPNNELFADFPQLGFNKNWIVVTANLRLGGDESGFDHTRVYMFDKTNLYAGGTNVTITNLSSSLQGTIQPMTTSDPAVSTLYCLQTWNTAEGSPPTGSLRIYTVTGTPSSPTFTATTNYAHSRIGWADNAGTNNIGQQLSNSVGIWLLDSHVANVVYRYSTLWAVQTVFLPITNPSYTGLQWWRIAPDGFIGEIGVLTNSSKSYAYPSIAVNRFQEMLIGYSSFSSTQYASAEYMFRAQGESKFRLPTTLKAGLGDYVLTDSELRNRWGDYSATMTDPVNDTDFWTIQPFAEPKLTSKPEPFNGRWGTWWGNVAVAVPGNDNFANAYQLSGTEGTTNCSLFRATREVGEPDHGGTGGTRSIWFKWTPAATGGVTFNTLESLDNIDTLLAVYTGTSVSSLALVASNDNARGGKTNLTSALGFTAISNTVYYVAVDARDTSAENHDSIVLQWDQPQSPVFVANPNPSDVNVLAGDTFILASSVVGIVPLSYQWRTNGVSISGATSANYTNTNPQSATTNSSTTYQYDVVASNSAGSATSLVANVTVYPSATSTHTNWTYDLSSNLFSFHVFGVTNHTYAVEATVDFTNWVTLTNQTASFDFTNHLVTTNYPYRFFRTQY